MRRLIKIRLHHWSDGGATLELCWDFGDERTMWESVIPHGDHAEACTIADTMRILHDCDIYNQWPRHATITPSPSSEPQPCTSSTRSPAAI